MTDLALTYSDDPRIARLGASEVAAILGLSPWRTPFGVWARKMGAPDPNGTPATRRGRYLERGVLDWLRDDAGADALVSGPAYDSPWVVAPDGSWPHIGCHPDGYLRIGDTWHGAEAKTARSDRGWGAGGDAVPTGYWIQVQIGLALTGFPAWELGVLLSITDEFRRYTIAPDEAVAAEMLQRAEDWWARHIAAGEPPEVDGSTDARRWLFDRHPREQDTIRPATPEEEALAERVHTLRAAIREFEAEEKAKAQALQLAIGDAAGLSYAAGKATWKAQQAERIDVTRLRAEDPATAARYTRTDSTRVLRVTYKEER